MPKIHDKASGHATDTVRMRMPTQVSFHMLLIRSADLWSYEFLVLVMLGWWWSEGRFNRFIGDSLR